MIEYIIEDRVCYCIDKLILEIVRFNDCDLYIYLGFYIYIYIYRDRYCKCKKKENLFLVKFYCLLNWLNI